MMLYSHNFKQNRSHRGNVRSTSNFVIR